MFDVQTDIRHYVNLENVYVTQADLRYTDHRLLDMIAHVRNQGLWTLEVLLEWGQRHGCKQTSPIQITRFEDNRLYLHDGNHRGVTTWLGGRKYLHHSEYKITDMNYAQYGDLNFKVGYYTPFDPRREVRLPDIKAFKTEVKRLIAKDPLAAVDYISLNRHLYCVSHPPITVPELAAKVEKTILSSGDSPSSC